MISNKLRRLEHQGTRAASERLANGRKFQGHHAAQHKDALPSARSGVIRSSGAPVPSQTRLDTARRVVLRIPACLAAIALLVTGCTSTSSDGPTSSNISVSVTATPSVADVSPSPSSPLASTSATTASTGPGTASKTKKSSDPAAREVSDRATVERAWAHFWEVTDSLPTVPEAERHDAAASVAVEPTLSQVLGQAKNLADNGLVVYGTSQFHPYWEQSIDGKSTALMGDCTDTSRSGSKVLATGEKRTVGVADNNTRVTLVKGLDGVWRVKEIFFLLDVKC